MAAVALAGALFVAAYPNPGSALDLQAVRGHLSVGYAKLVAEEETPGGSLSFAGGLDYPIAGDWRAGVEVGYSLLGGRIIEDETSTFGGELDYSVFEASLLAHWVPPRGPVGLVSLGPGVFNARADLTSSAPVGFADLAIEETVGGVSISAALMPRRDAPLKAGLELGMRSLWLPDDTWTVLSARLLLRY